MRSVIVLTLVALFASETLQTSSQIGYGTHDQCISNQHAVNEFLTAFNAFAIDLYKITANRGNNFFILSPQATWITLAAIAEGSDQKAQKKLFGILNLPHNACTRQKFYQIATSRTSPNPYVNIFNTRTIVIDKNVGINPNWYNLVKQHSLLRVMPAPIKEDPVTTSNMIKKCMLLENHDLNFNGNSVLMNRMDYTGLWTTAFDNAKIERAPFYSQDGQRLGSVDLMKTKRRVRIGYVESLNATILELPIGSNGEYRMIFGLSEINPTVEQAVASLNNRTMFEVVASLQDSYVPIDIAIPRFVITSAMDMKELLEDLGVVRLWQDPQTTRYISTPPANPTSYIQRATLTMDSPGIYPSRFDYQIVPHLRNEKRDFVADKPFMFGLFDAETYTCIMAGLFSRPTYPY